MARDLVNRFTRDINTDNLTVRVLDFHGRRITNASDAIGNQDYVTKKQLEDRLGSASSAGASIVESFTMNASPYNITLAASPTVGKILTVILIQDGTGSRVPVWPASCLNAPTSVYYLAGTKSVIGFVESGGFWQWDARFETGL